MPTILYINLRYKTIEIAAPCEDKRFCSEMYLDCTDEYFKENCPKHCGACPW